MKAMALEKLLFLKSYPLFGEFTDSDLETLEPLAKIKKWDDVEPLFNENDPTDGIYFLRSGRVQIFQAVPKEKDITIAMVEAGSPVGEIGLADGLPRTASARTLGRGSAAFISLADYTRLEADQPGVAVKIVKVILQVMSARLREFTGKMFSVNK